MRLEGRVGTTAVSEMASDRICVVQLLLRASTNLHVGLAPNAPSAVQA